MRIVTIAVVVILGLAMLGGAAAVTPKRATITGKITVLKLKTITVHGSRTLTCRITTSSPKRLGFALGTMAKVTCTRGVLTAIRRPLVVTPVTPTNTGTTTTTTTTTPTETGTGGVKVAPTVNGTGAIRALGGGQIEFGSSITCQLGSGSPSVAGYRVGSNVRYTCTAGTLTAISASEAA
jgi:hypothetical protein